MTRRDNSRSREHRSSFFETMEGRQMFAGGGLDPSFSLDGKAAVSFGNGVTAVAKDVAVQPDGKTVVVGEGFTGTGSAFRNYFAVARFNVDGTPDRTFGPPSRTGRGLRDGKFLTSFSGGGATRAEAVAVQPDGKIVVAGQTMSGGDSAFAVARYRVDGTLDTSFDGDGKLVIRFENAHATSIALQHDGKIVVAGGDWNGGIFSIGDTDFAVARLNPNGSLDRTFDGDGKKVIGFGAHDTVEAVAIDYTGTSASNANYGKIVLAGDHENLDYRGYAVTRLNTNGSVDRNFNYANSFNHDGKLIASFDGVTGSMLGGMIIQRDGKIVLAGTSGVMVGGGAQQFAVARLNSDGWFDRSFGTRGTVITGFGGSDIGGDVVQSADGGLIVGGTVNGKLALAGYTADGRLNPGFGGGGRVQLYHGDVRYGGEIGLALAPGRKLVIAGGHGFAAARLLDNGGSLEFDPTLIGNAIVGIRMFGATAPAKQSATQPTGSRASELFSNSRVDALMTL